MSQKIKNLCNKKLLLSLVMSCIFSGIILSSHAMQGIMYDPANYADPSSDADDEAVGQYFDHDSDVDDAAHAMDAVHLDEVKEVKAAGQLNDNDTALAYLLKEMNTFLAKHPINGKTIQLREAQVKQDKFRLNRYQQKIECFALGDEIESIGHISYAIVASPLSAYLSDYKSDNVSILEMKLTAPYQNIGIEHFLIYAALNDAFDNNYEEDCPVEAVVLPSSFREVLIKDAGLIPTENRIALLTGSLQKFRLIEKDCLAKAHKLFISKSEADRIEDTKRAIKMGIDRLEASDKRLDQCLFNFKKTIRDHLRSGREHA